MATDKQLRRTYWVAMAILTLVITLGLLVNMKGLG